MTMMPVAERMTADEFLALAPDPSIRRRQLIDGEIVVEAPLPRHQIACGIVFGELWVWTRAAPSRGLVIQPLDVKLDDANVYEPDLLWYPEGRAPGRDGGRPSPLPALAVEVRSPSTWRYDIGTKTRVYEREGLPELWLVDTAADVVLVFRRCRPDAPAFDVARELARGDALTSPLLPGFALALDELFGD